MTAFWSIFGQLVTFNLQIFLQPTNIISTPSIVISLTVLKDTSQSSLPSTDSASNPVFEMFQPSQSKTCMCPQFWNISTITQSRNWWSPAAQKECKCGLLWLKLTKCADVTHLATCEQYTARKCFWLCSSYVQKLMSMLWMCDNVAKNAFAFSGSLGFVWAHEIERKFGIFSTRIARTSWKWQPWAEYWEM